MSAEQSGPARVIEVRADSDDAAPPTGEGGASKAASDDVEPSGKGSVAPALPAKSTTPNAPAATTVVAKSTAKSVPKSGEGLDEEVLTQIAQAKFEAQEDRLKDVARHTMSLLRDYSRLNSTDCTRRVAEIRKSLLRYEMQYIRAWEYQERRRKLEIEALEKEAERCRQESEEEGVRIIELRQILEKEKRRRKRYEGYEAAAAEVNRKKTRTDSQTEIDTVTAEIARLQQQTAQTEAFIEQRQQRAQLLVHAVAELQLDLQREQQINGNASDQHEGGASITRASVGKGSGADNPSGAAIVGTVAAATATTTTTTTAQSPADLAEVIS